FYFLACITLSSIAAVSSLLSGQCSSIGGQLCDYHFIGENMTWKEAQDYCRKNHTDLATVSNQTDMQRLLDSTTEQYQGGAWIGLQDNTTNTAWRWSQSGVEFNETCLHYNSYRTSGEQSYPLSVRAGKLMYPKKQYPLKFRRFFRHAKSM
uniref:C-type lectin domain-containing protein n=1 Tax=Sander lucioperca TaxID=283035 RepID=A0A8C9XDP9_SANLU